MKKAIQAKHLADRDILALVLAISMGEKERRFADPDGYWAKNRRQDAWVFAWDLEHHLPGVHPKVLAAKMKALVRRKLVDGCTCGCRGDFWVTDLGVRFLEAS